MASPASSATMNTVASKAPGDTGLRVLVVDDNIDAATSLAMLVRANGYDVRTAFTGRAAVATAIDFEPHVVLLDIGLPDLDGLQAAKQIRQQLVLNHVVLVAMTGYGQIEDYQRSMKAGFDYHLVKPADFRQVQEILTTVKVH